MHILLLKYLGVPPGALPFFGEMPGEFNDHFKENI